MRGGIFEVRNREKRKKVSLLLLCVLLIACMMPQAAFAGSWNEDDEITITVRVFAQSTGNYKKVGTDTVTKGDKYIQSDVYKIPPLSKFTNENFGRVIKVAGNWYFPTGDRNVGSTVQFSCNSNTATITYWVDYFGNSGGDVQKQYVLTYMDGETKVGEDKVVQGKSTTAKGALTKDGFDFKGWTLTKGGSTVDYEAGARITPSGDMTLYAVWEAKSNPQPPTPGGDDPKPPAPPTLGELKEAVTVKCEAKPAQHAEEHFALNDADKQTLTKVSDTEYTFSISPQAYADAYNLTSSANGKTHKLSEGQTVKVIRILWDAQSESWKIDKEKTPLSAEFKVACTDEEKPPTPSRPGHTRYIVRWMLEDGTILETDYERYGTTPKYDGSTPSKAETDEFTYEFVGWQPEISMVTKDIDYTAVFKAIPKEKEPKEKPTQPVSEPQPTDTKDTDKKKDTGKTEQRNENDSEVPKTGDQTMANAIFYLILLAGTAGGMTICMLRKPQK